MTSLPAEIKFVAVRAGSETFLIDIMAVRQVVPYSGSTVVLKDAVIPVVDVAARVAPEQTAPGEQPVVLLTHTRAGAIGLKVDEVRRLLTLPADQLLPAPPMVRGIRGEFLVGVAPHGNEVFLVLDVDAVAHGRTAGG